MPSQGGRRPRLQHISGVTLSSYNGDRQDGIEHMASQTRAKLEEGLPRCMSSIETSHYLGLTELGRFRPTGNLSSCSLGWDDSVLQRRFYNRQRYTLNPASDPDLENRLGKKGTVFLFFFFFALDFSSLFKPEGISQGISQLRCLNWPTLQRRHRLSYLTEGKD